MQNGGGCCYEHDSTLPWAVPESCTSEGISTSALTGVSWDITIANNLWAAACEGPSTRCLACQRQQAASCEASLPEHLPSCWAAPGAEWHQHSNLLHHVLTQTPGMMFKQTVYGVFMKQNKKLCCDNHFWAKVNTSSTQWVWLKKNSVCFLLWPCYFYHQRAGGSHPHLLRLVLPICARLCRSPELEWTGETKTSHKAWLLAGQKGTGESSLKMVGGISPKGGPLSALPTHRFMT